VEDECIATAAYCTQVLWMKETRKDMKVHFNEPISIKCDNASAISISKNHVLHSKTKHIPIKYHFLREQVTQQIMKLEYIPTKEQITNIFTNPLTREPFEYLRNKLGIIYANSLH